MHAHSSQTKPESSQRALITGASSGIGFHLAREFARHGHPLVLVARDVEKLEIAAEKISAEHQVAIRTISCDLKDPDDIDFLASELQLNGEDIEILCNNAGVGHRGKFWDTSLQRHDEVIDLNVTAVTHLIHQFLPSMVSRGHGRILNTASVAGFQPGPLMAVYHASKAFVLSLSEALSTELKDTSVTVTALCPGPVDTEFFEKADMVETRAFQKANLMAPQEVAEAAYKAVMAGERDVIPGGLNKLSVFARRILPLVAQAKENEVMYTNVSPKDHTREPGDVEAKEEAK